MRGPGQAENPQYGCKVDNKYDAIADCDDPLENLDRLELAAQLVKKDAGAEKGKPKSGEKQAAGTSGGAKKAADAKKEAAGANRAQTATAAKQQDGAAKKQAGERGGAQERPKTAGDKPARADHAQQGYPRGGAAARGGAVPQQAGVVGLATSSGEAEHQGGEDYAAGDGFQSQRGGSGNYRGRRGGPRGGAYAPRPPAPGGVRRPYRGGFGGGSRFPPAQPVAGGEQEADQAPAVAGAAPAEGGEGEDRVDRSFERRRPYGYGPSFRGGPGYPRRGGNRRGAPVSGSFEEGTGRKREFERHSGSDMTGVKPVDKKDGAGQHNWGTDRDDLAGQTETNPEGEQAVPKRVEAQTSEAWTDLVHADESAKAAEGTSGDGQQEKQYVLDDWKAREEKDRFRVPEFNVRKPNEGVDQSAKWNDFVLKKREEGAEQENAPEDEEAYAGVDFGDEAKRKAKQRVNIPVKFSDPVHRGRGAGYGGRGGPRGGAGGPPHEGGEHRVDGGAHRGGYDRPRGDRGGYRGGYRGGAQSGAPQLTMDEFPSLNKQA